CCLLDLRKIPRYLLGHRGRRSREPKGLSLDIEDGGHLVHVLHILLVAVVAYLVEKIDADEHATGEPCGETEDIDKGKSLGLHHIAPGYLEIIEDHVCLMLVSFRTVKSMPDR